jgi:CRP/FNR family transcriptional regulator, cyclic AMP receptor protein
MTAAPEAMLSVVIKRDWNRPTIKDWVDVLATVPLFERVGRRRLRKVAELAEVREFEPRSVVLQAGDPQDGFYVVLSGDAKIVGRPHSRARTLHAGDYFGEMALLDGEPRSATVVAVGELQTMRIPRRSFLKLLEREPQIAVRLLGELAGRVRRLETSSVA